MKVMAVFLAVIVVLCAVYLYSYITSMNLLKNEKTAALKNAGISQVQMMDKQISDAKRAIYNAYATQNWNSLAMNPGYVQDFSVLQQVSAARDRISVIYDNSEIIAEILIHFPRWGRSISATAGLIDYERARWENVSMPQDSVGAQIVYLDSHAYLTSRYQMTNPQLYSIDAELSYEKSYQSFGDYTMMGVPLNNYLLDTGSGTILLSHEDLGDDDEFIRNSILDLKFEEDRAFTLNKNGNSYLILSAASTYSNLRVVNAFRPTDLVKPFAQQTQLVILFTALISFSVVLVLVFVKYYIIKPIDNMVEAFKPVERGDFSVRLQTNSTDEFAELYDSFNHMVENLQVLVNEVYQKELLVQHADLKQLQSQINPHFMYNSLYALSTMIKIDDNENADRFCMYLASYFRYITRSGSDLMNLTDEWQHAGTYLNIMTMRNSSVRLDFQQDLPEQVRNLHVPRLIIQPIIENAFKHGGKTVTGFRLKISAVCEDNRLLIKVEDNDKGTSDQELEELNTRLNDHQSGQEITGLINIHRRLQLVFGPDSGLLISRSELGGICVTAVLVLKGGDQDDLPSHGG